MKFCIAPKSVSTFEADASQLCIFEGFTDFLAAMAYYKTDKPKYKTIVLNSLSFLTEDFLQEQASAGYTRLHSFTDNDEQGIAANEKLLCISPTLIHHTASVFPKAKDWAEGWEKF